jgi:putative transposase
MNEKSSCPVLRGRDDGDIILLPDHMAAAYDGEHTHLLNGRLLRSKRQYRNKLISRMDAKISHCKKAGKRRRKLIRAKQKRLSKLTHQIQDIEHLVGIRATRETGGMR